MKKFLIDADIILEYLLNREEFRIEAEYLWRKIEYQQFEAFITEVDLKKLTFILAQLTNTNDRVEVFEDLQKLIKICHINQDTIHKARTSHLRSFDAAIQVVCATQMNLDAIVAWNFEYFDIETSIIKVFSLHEFCIFVLDTNFSEQSKKTIEDSQSKTLSKEALGNLRLSFEEGIKRINVVNKITSNVNLIVETSFQQMILNNETLVQPGGNCDTHRRIAACLRDTEIILRYLTYALYTGNENILQDRCLNGLKETYSALGVPIDSSIDSVNIMKENIIHLIHQLTHDFQLTTDGDYASIIEELNRYFDMIVSSLD